MPTPLLKALIKEKRLPYRYDKKFFLLRRITSFMRTKPNFLIIGAQKSGTTSLYNYLTEHPDIGHAFRKEIYYFDSNYEKGFKWYKANFPTILHRLFNRYFTVGEATPTYLVRPKVVKRIKNDLPDVKLIVILRNPIDRAYSIYKHLKRNHDLDSFEEEIKKAKKIEMSGEKLPDRRSLLEWGKYYNHLKNFSYFFETNRIKVIKFEDFVKDTQYWMNEIFTFLGLPKYNLECFEKFNKTNQKHMNPETRKELSAYFEPYNKKLYDLIGKDFGWK